LKAAGSKLGDVATLSATATDTELEETMDTVTIDTRLSQPAKEFLHQPSRLLIDGKLVEAASGKTFPVYNPATGAILMQVPEADNADVDRAVKAARKAFDEGPWSKVSPSERGKLLWKLAELLEKHSDEFAEIESIDNGKPVTVARAADVPLAIDMFRYMGGWATKITGSTIPLSFPGEFLSASSDRSSHGTSRC
jgi:phenylacetaldehyde dehydrogenase